jgi:hypothetical protein
VLPNHETGEGRGSVGPPGGRKKLERKGGLGGTACLSGVIILHQWLRILWWAEVYDTRRVREVGYIL